MALWWIYFARSAQAAREVFVSSEDPGRIARSAYTYFHLPMIAGIIAVAASDELTVAHPGDPGTAASVVLTIGGTALFLAGHAFFKWAVFGVLPWSRAVAIAALAGLMPVGFALPTLALSSAAVLDRGSPCGVGRPSLSKTPEFATTVHQIRAGRWLPSRTGGNPKAKKEFPAVRVTDMCNASTARYVMAPWSGRQMTSFSSQSTSRNTHLAHSPPKRQQCGINKRTG